MFNRTLTVVALGGIGGLSILERRFHLRRSGGGAELDATDTDGRVYEEILQLFKQMTAVLISVVIVAVVAVADFVTPAQYNLPILYGVPLVICAMTGRRLLLWTMLPVLLVFTYAGYVIGPASSEVLGHTSDHGPEVVFGSSVVVGVPAMLSNRTLAACVMVASALVLHWWVASNDGEVVRIGGTGRCGITPR